MLPGRVCLHQDQCQHPSQDSHKQARGWQNMEFTYTVTIKIKAPFLNPPLPTPPNLVCSSHPPMFFLEGTISYWQPSLLNILYQWQWQWQLNSAVSTAPSPTFHAHQAHWLARNHANHPCAWCRPCHCLQGIMPSISKHHTCQDSVQGWAAVHTAHWDSHLCQPQGCWPIRRSPWSSPHLCNVFRGSSS